MSIRLRWRREPLETGLARVTQGERGYQLWASVDGRRVHVASVCPHIDRFRSWAITGWYWYAGDEELGVRLRNTVEDGVQYATAEQAKAACEIYVRDCLTRAEKERTP